MFIQSVREYLISHKYNLILGSAVVLISVIVLIVTNTKGNVSEDEEFFEFSNEISTELTTYDISASTEETTNVVSGNTSSAVKCYFNSDGKLYGNKGEFSGLWPELEAAARASNEQYIKDLIPFVGDNTELKKSDYENDKFKDINGYGTVHWSQSGHKWPNRYSRAASGYITTTEKVNEAFDNLEQKENTEETTSENEYGPISASEIVLSDSALETEETAQPKTITKIVSFEQLAQGKVWASNSCGVCSLAMALSTLSGVTVSPPEVALAANLLIGNSAWYDTILYSKAQAKLAELAGFKVVMEPYNKAKKATMDDCLSNNGVALFVTNQSDWVSGGGRHYIMVRNKVGDKYYTADSGKNPTGGFTYEEISAGYCQQYIVYIYPKQ
jgi:hypothetical protein